MGADRAGARGRTAESIGSWVAERLLEDLESHATVDRHLADMLPIFAGLAEGTSRYRAPLVSAHLETNLRLVERFGASTSLEGTSVTIHGIGRIPDASPPLAAEASRRAGTVTRRTS